MSLIPAKHVKLDACLILLASLAVARLSFAAKVESTPGAAEIIRRSVVVNTADWNAQPQYSFRKLETRSKVDDNGRTGIVSSKTYEVMMLEGSPYERLTATDNEPLKRAQQQQEQVKLNREIERRQSESSSDRQDRISKYQSERSEEHVLMQQMVAAFNFRFAGEQQIDGTDCYVLDAVPNPDYRPAVQRAKVLTGMRGRLWIDKAHYHWVKVEAEVTSPVEFGLFVARVKPGTRFQLDQAPVAGVWLPKCFTQTVNATVLGFYGMRTREEEHYSDYHQTNLRAQRW